jgi:bifunctional non-homologous end joining protein LigD
LAQLSDRVHGTSYDALGRRAAQAERRQPIEERKWRLANLLDGSHLSLVLNEHYEEDGAIVFREACKLGCEGIVSKRLGSPYRSGRSAHWVKVKNPKAPAVKREAEEDWGR